MPTSRTQKTAYELIKGPQDGGKVRNSTSLSALLTIHVGPKYLGDGWVAWSREKSKRFPACYTRCHDWDHFVFQPHASH